MNNPMEIRQDSTGLPSLDQDETPPRTNNKPKGSRKNSAGRFEMLNCFVDESIRKIGTSAVKVWFILYRDTKPNGQARTGQGDIAQRAGVSVRTVRRAIQQLVSCGLVSIIRQGRIGIGPTVYRCHGIPRTNQTPVSAYNRTNPARTKDNSVTHPIKGP